ncbi:MAG TPA: SDR family NAD(P)-dependent oxidoreductase [Symbiobacteriaceae bacterium]|nr:SDR family NAD(P)-dependent oxidoreductase [Symbiobacteriaceae bacterium]
MSVAERLGLREGELSGQVAVITGAGQGIGREAAAALAALGAKVVVADINEETGRETAALIAGAGGVAAFVRTDVSRETDVAKLAMWTLADFGPADVLINNAILSPVASLMEMESDLFDRVIAVNLRGAFLTCRAFVPGMLIKKRGTVVNMVSADVMANMSAYIASKQGLTGFSQSLAAELGHEGIRVIAFAPGFVHTPGLLAAGERLAPRMGLTPAEFARLSFHPAYSGMMPAADAGAAAAYLVARLADHYAGEVVTGYTVLERAGVIAPSETAAAAAEAPVAPQAGPAAARERALALTGHLSGILAETEAEFSRLPVFVRPLARSGFKAKAGLSVSDWVRTVESLAGALGAGRPVSPDLLRLLGRLMGYYQGVPGEAARFTKDEALLQEITQTSLRRERVIQELLAALSSLLA